MQDQPTAFLIGASGIGGVVWHQPALRALAAKRGPLVVFARDTARAGDLVGHEPYVDRIVPYRRSKGARHVRCFLDLVAAFRASAYGEAWIFHDKTYYAAAAAFGGVPRRYGYGLGLQKLYLNAGRTIRSDRRFCGEGGTVESTRRLLLANGNPIGLETPRLTPRPDRVDAVLARLAAAPRPWFVLGTTCLEESRRWSPRGFAILAKALIDRWGGTVLFTGAPDHAWQIAQTTEHLPPDGSWIDLAREAMALPDSIVVMDQAAAYIGNDSGPLNIAAALGTPAYGLFGDHAAHASLSPEIQVVLPDPTLPGATGMARITPEAIMTRLLADGFDPSAHAGLRERA